jgi:hypothetical protein
MQEEENEEGKEKENPHLREGDRPLEVPEEPREWCQEPPEVDVGAAGGENLPWVDVCEGELRVLRSKVLHIQIDHEIRLGCGLGKEMMPTYSDEGVIVPNSAESPLEGCKGLK